MINKPSSCGGCPLYEIPYGTKSGFVPLDGSATSGVMFIGEAAGENESNSGVPFVGKSGHYLFNGLKRVGIEREGIAIGNVLSCRPPNNKLVKTPWEHDSIRCCTSKLDENITEARKVAKENGKTFTILTLGKTAFMRVFGLDAKRDFDFLKLSYQNYPIWSQKYEAWVIATYHPSYLMQGKHNLLPTLQFAAQRAMEIASEGLTYEKHNYLEDPSPEIFKRWMLEFFEAFRKDPDNTFLSYDIETPFKQGADEEDVSKEDDDDYTILRCSFSYRPNEAVSVPWSSEYFPYLEEIFAHPCTKVGWNNENYDDPRVRAQLTLNGLSIDAMLAWHVLNTSMPKGLGFVTPFYAQNVQMWKHLSSERPAFYNAKDADMALRCWLGIREDLKENNLWDVFDRHVIQINKVFAHMSVNGVMRDEVKRQEAEDGLSEILKVTDEGISETIPQTAKALKVYKKTPKVTDGLVEVRGKRNTKICPRCLKIDVKADHFKSIGIKRLKSGMPENPCVGLKSEKLEIDSTLWAKPLDFKISNTSLKRYQKAVSHKAILSRKEKKVTFNEQALFSLMKKYPDDKLYPKILEHRNLQGLLSKYIGVTENGKIRGGLTIGDDRAIHTTFTHNPSTLRSAAQNPPLQQLPRPSKTKDDPVNLIRNLVVARPGHTFYARDYSGIEAVLVGYEAKSPGYIRLSLRDVHSFYTAYALHELDGRVSANDLPLLSWDDEKLFKRLAEIKKEFASDRNSLYKHLVHGANFFQGPMGARDKILKETGIAYPVSLVSEVMEIYFELFPEIRTWHREILAQADKDGYLRNSFGYVHRFNKIYDWEKIGGQWQKEPGPEANKAIAFKPQSNAAGIIKEAMLRIFFNHFEAAGQWLRLLIHDELFFEPPVSQLHELDKIVKIEMEAAIKQMPLPKSYKMGEYLSILTEEKIGERWGEMR